MIGCPFRRYPPQRTPDHRTAGQASGGTARAKQVKGGATGPHTPALPSRPGTGTKEDKPPGPHPSHLSRNRETPVSTMTATCLLKSTVFAAAACRRLRSHSVILRSPVRAAAPVRQLGQPAVIVAIVVSVLTGPLLGKAVGERFVLILVPAC
jgi:hypothetical protein